MLRRRLTFQLTPLLDLLLIVIFAQYMEVRETSARQVADIQQQVAAIEQAAERQLQQARAAHQQAQDRLRAEFEAEQDRLRQQQARADELQALIDQLLAQQQRAGDTAAELFQLPPEVVEEALAPLAAADPPRTPAQIEEIRKRFAEAAQMRGQQVIKHLLTYDEVRKRCDVWEIYIRPNGEILFVTGDQHFTFRARDAKDFEIQLFNRYKTLPQPKDLVILLVSYGETPFRYRESVLNGLPHAAARMREDSNGRSRFEYAVIGLNPLPPQIR